MRRPCGITRDLSRIPPEGRAGRQTPGQVRPDVLYRVQSATVTDPRARCGETYECTSSDTRTRTGSRHDGCPLHRAVLATPSAGAAGAARPRFAAARCDDAVARGVSRHLG